MTVEVAMNTPLADALHSEIQPKLVEYGWVPSDASDTTMAEYLILMVVNGKTEDEIASELSSDLLNLPAEDTSAKQFARWLFELIETENAKINGPPQGQLDAFQDSGDQDMDMDMTNPDLFNDIHAPTGPKAMRDGGRSRGGRGDRRILGQINRTLDRTRDSGGLHRVRGANDRINTHNRASPMGLRGGAGGFGVGRQPRNMNNRTAANFNHAMAAGLAGGPQSGMPWMGPAAPGGMAPGPMDVYAMLEQQSRMMQQMQEQMQQQQQIMQQGGRRGGGFNNRGRALADRIQHPNQNHKSFRNGGSHFHQQGGENGGDGAKSNGSGGAEGDATGDDVDMGGEGGSGGRREGGSSVAETICKYNLHCTNKDCKFAHQSPAAPPGITVDVHDVCSFGAACKNKKCVARHPSPAARAAHQSEQDCKFYPNCTNPHCLFRHPSMPLCRNGGDCAAPGCKFTHITTLCKFRPCTNRYCTFKHEEGQRGTFPDKVWTAEGGSEGGSNGAGGKHGGVHISERTFVDESAPQETILPHSEAEGMATANEASASVA